MSRRHGGRTPTPSPSPSPSPSQEHVVDGATETRPYVGCVTQKSFVEDSVSRKCSLNIKGHVFGPWLTFRVMPHAERDVLWEQFQTQYMWPVEETTQVRAAWQATMTRRYTSLLKRARNKALLKVGGTTDDLSVIRGHGPKWITPPVWDALLVQWMSPEWQEKSKKAKLNRGTKKAGDITKHSGGSISFATHSKRMAKELGRAPTKTELFMRTHQKKGSSSYVDGKSQAVLAAYETMFHAKYGYSTSDQVPFDYSLWVEASGGMTKGKVYGFGGHQHGMGSSSISTGSSARGSTQSTAHDESQYISRAEFTEAVEGIVRRMMHGEDAECRAEHGGDCEEGGESGESGESEDEEDEEA